MRDNQGRGRGRTSGRGRGRSRRQGRSFNSSRNTNRFNNNTITTAYKFYPHTAGKQQSITYDTVKEHIIKQIQKTYQHGQDIATTLTDLKIINLNQFKPVRIVSQNTNNEIKKQEQEENDIIYQEEVKEFVKRKNTLQSNLGKAYALILTYCNKTMENRIVVHPDYESKIRNDPI